MEPIKEFVAALFSDPKTNLVLGLLIALPIVDWVTGSLRAVATRTFKWYAADVFIRTQIAGRALPLFILIVFGQAVAVAVPNDLQIPGLDLSILTGAGMLAALPFVLVEIKSIIDNVNPNAADVVPTVNEEPA